MWKRIASGMVILFWGGLTLLQAEPIEVGAGVNVASVTIQWADGFSREYRVHFGASESDTTTGLGLMDIIEAETDLTTVRNDLGWGEFIDGISVPGHSNSGYGGGDLWWHYWINNAGSRSPWMSPNVGAADRIVAHGNADAWIYGSAAQPVPSGENPFLDGYGQYVFDANDFATSWVSYQPVGMGYDYLNQNPFDDPNNALGRPTVDTSGDDWYLPVDMNTPVVSVYGPFRSHELVWLGQGGSLTLSFNHPVRDDPENPYGIDLLVFGHAMMNISSDTGWTGGDPALVTVGSSEFDAANIVSVSQDGQRWYSFTTDANYLSDHPQFLGLDVNAPLHTTVFPTLGRVYDPCYADANLGDWNHWWAGPTNPTLPLDPNLDIASFAGQSVARMAQNYGDSAGGTGYDIGRLKLPSDPNTGLKWFRYVRIDDAPGGGSTVVDAVADVTCPGDYRHPNPTGDLNGDFRVDENDVALVQALLSQNADASDQATAADLDGDGVVDQNDLDIVTAHLGQSRW